MSKESIFILGAGIMQVPAIKSAAELGYRVIVADVNPEAEGIALADDYLPIDLKDRHAIAEAAVKLRKEEHLQAVFTAGTDFSATVAYAAAAAGLPGLDYSAAMTASNKILMRRAFAEAGVPSPAFYPVKNSREALEACMNLDFPVVIKPVDSMGARGVVRIESLGDEAGIIDAVEKAVDASGTAEAIVEEFMDGPEFSLDAIVYNGEVSICGFADRHIFFPPYFIEMGHTMPTACSEELQAEVVDVFIRGIHAIGIDNGAAKGDMKYSSKKGAMVGEIAARLSGGFMSGWTFPYHSGINLTAEAIKIACGRGPGSLVPPQKKVSAERAAVSIPGKVASIEGIESARAVESIQEVFLHTEVGEGVVFPVNNVQKCANCISAAEGYDIAVAAAEEAVRQIFIRLVPGNSETAAFLRGEGYEWVPDAYVLTREADLSFIKGLVDSEGGIPPELKKEAAVDWHGLGLAEAVDRVKGFTGCTDSDLNSGFWSAFLRGGVQGGVWYLETEALLR
ncbi:MAG: ATP-grasp domain-containing protein [Spirochaetales bacterium]|uniref:ATP-grasp domain-containing protein n=1 Tax=Candidatus Thalassospirochaeta sargassi TaxID=3119039 RepID=A0AAJ1IHR7_9SPIO|nr:ATP-grasp domain-containing protein [Spirochaetales bacterium]